MFFLNTQHKKHLPSSEVLLFYPFSQPHTEFYTLSHFQEHEIQFFSQGEAPIFLPEKPATKHQKDYPSCCTRLHLVFPSFFFQTLRFCSNNLLFYEHSQKG